MTRVILDPELFECGASKQAQMDCVATLQYSVKFAADHFLDPFLDRYDGAPYVGDSGPPFVEPPITHSMYVKTVYTQFKTSITKLMKRKTVVDVTNQPPAQCALVCTVPNGVTRQPFLRYLSALVADNTPSVLLLSGLNRNQSHKWNRNQSPQSPQLTVTSGAQSRTLYAVYRPATDCNHVVAQFLYAPRKPDDMFPRSGACKALNDAFKAEKRGNSNVNLAVFIKYATETAERNKYAKNPSMSANNTRITGKMRIVFAKPNGKYYLSADLESGGFEVFDAKSKKGDSYKHLGEYNYSGVQTGAPDKTGGHPLY